MDDVDCLFLLLVLADIPPVITKRMINNVQTDTNCPGKRVVVRDIRSMLPSMFGSTPICYPQATCQLQPLSSRFETSA